MHRLESKNIEEATKRVRERLPLEKIQSIPKYKDLSAEDYEGLIKSTETVALLILKSFILNNRL